MPHAYDLMAYLIDGLIYLQIVLENTSDLMRSDFLGSDLVIDDNI